MKVLLVQGTWGDDDQWWRRSPSARTEERSFADAVIESGHELVNGRYFEWSTGLGGINPFSRRDLNVWRGAGRHLFDYCVPPRCQHALAPEDLAVVMHSHGRQVGKYAFKFGLKAAVAVFVSGPIRADVDDETTGWRANVNRVVTLNGGRADRLYWLGALGDLHFGRRRRDPESQCDCRWTHCKYSDATHGSLLRDPAQYYRVLQHLHGGSRG